MTDQQHPITPPSELVKQWVNQFAGNQQCMPEQVYIAKAAAQWGADQELEACCEWLESEPDPGHVDLLRSCATALRATRRPKPPSLTDDEIDALVVCIQALPAPTADDCKLDSIDKGRAMVRRALERYGQ